MQKTIYACDQCETEIGENKHLSLVMAASESCGVALPPNIPKGVRDSDILPSEMGGQPTRTYWQVATKGVRGRFLHFCNAQCLMRYFSKLLRETK